MDSSVTTRGRGRGNGSGKGKPKGYKHQGTLDKLAALRREASPDDVARLQDRLGTAEGTIALLRHRAERAEKELESRREARAHEPPQDTVLIHALIARAQDATNRAKGEITDAAADRIIDALDAIVGVLEASLVTPVVTDQEPKP